ncbi:MAG: nucleotide-binding protein [Candidatus Omnitrophica bacterium]|nr:nucleotide-binding protein [Candidatus Omnitrophota bacterium]
MGAAKTSRQALVVPGLDVEMSTNVVNTLTKLGFDPVVFDAQDKNSPKELIEGFDKYENAALAVVILADDEVGTLRLEFPKNVKLRARPQVVFLGGFLLGKFGSDKVVFLYLPRQNFEFPFEMEKLSSIPYDDKNRWHFDFLKELKARGFSVDANQLI